MRLVNNMGDAGLNSAAATACNNWGAAAGPQYCSYTVRTNDTITNLYIDNNLIAPDRYAFNCALGACPLPGNAGQVEWSEIKVAPGNNNNVLHPCPGVGSGVWATAVFAHELGHTYGLAHHGDYCSNVTTMTQGSTFQGPTAIEIGP